MKEFTFEITLTEADLGGDEFWEEALAHDGTGIVHLTEAIAEAIKDSNLLIGSDKNPEEVIRLISYKDEDE